MKKPPFTYNPYNGKKRDPRDVQSDPRGTLILSKDEPMRSYNRPAAVLPCDLKFGSGTLKAGVSMKVVQNKIDRHSESAKKLLQIHETAIQRLQKLNDTNGVEWGYYNEIRDIIATLHK